MARELRNVEHRAEKLGLSDEEVAFYDAVAQGRDDWADHENAIWSLRFYCSFIPSYTPPA